MRFDWYSATIPGGADEVLGVLSALGGVERCRPLYGYGEGVRVARGEEVVAMAFWGGVNGYESVHVQASGDRTPEVVEVVRSEWPSHRVSRADACRDYSHLGAWRRLVKLAIGVARDHEVKTRTVGDWVEGKDGRTLMVGSKTARVQARVYEKGKQLAPFGDPNHVRVEVQVRPQGAEAKESLCVVPPERLWWSSQWSADMAGRLGEPKLEAIAIRPAVAASDEQRARYWLAVQYGAVLGRWGEEVGWANLPDAIEQLRARSRRGG